MTRVILTNLILFLLPFLLYVAFLYVSGRLQKEGFKIGVVPLMVLMTISLGLMATVAVFFIETEYNPPEGTFVAPSFSNGVVEPGRVD